jgi:catechol 2,3-dioxygenase-like lactoylglutathione lyase family enzyme
MSWPHRHLDEGDAPTGRFVRDDDPISVRHQWHLSNASSVLRSRTQEGRMALLAGINHVAFVSGDIDRLKDFYARVFDAECLLDDIVTHGENSARHAFIDVGGGCVLHPFELKDNKWLEPMPIFDRGRVDHIALLAPSADAFETIRDRLVAEGASDGTLTDFGSLFSVFFRDPDGMEAEVAYWKDGVPSA